MLNACGMVKFQNSARTDPEAMADNWKKKSKKNYDLFPLLFSLKQYTLPQIFFLLFKGLQGHILKFMQSVKYSPNLSGRKQWRTILINKIPIKYKRNLRHFPLVKKKHIKFKRVNQYRILGF